MDDVAIRTPAFVTPAFGPRKFSKVGYRHRRSICLRACALPPSVGSAYITVPNHLETARVLVVGCVHGSSVSADDARYVMGEAEPDVLVLELCPGRLATLQKNMTPRSPITEERPKKKQTFSSLKANFGGFGPALMALILNGMYDLQRVNGVTPGVEFQAALEGAEVLSEKPEIVCGDAEAKDTVRALATAFAKPLSSLYRIPAALRFLAWQLARPPPGGVSVAAALTAGAGARIREFATVFVPLVTGFYMSAALAGVVVGGVRDTVAVKSSAFGGVLAGDAIVAAGSLAQDAAALFLCLTSLTFMYVLVDERDRILAESIRKAVADAAARSSERPPVVVAVVGLLHVNGILRYLNNDCLKTKKSRIF